MIANREIAVDRRRARLWSGGKGPALLLLHGGMTDAPRHWRPVWDLLAARFTVYAPDLPGFGGSQALARGDYPGWIAWVEALRVELGLTSMTIAGNSFGGSLARFYASEHPQGVERLILLNGGGTVPRPPLATRLLLASPFGGPIMADRARKGMGVAAVARMFADPDAADPALLAACAASGEIFPVLRHCLTGPEPPLAWAAVPTLILWGEADRLVPLAAGRALADQAPAATFRSIPAAGHLPQIEQPQAVVDAIFAFSVTTTACGKRITP